MYAGVSVCVKSEQLRGLHVDVNYSPRAYAGWCMCVRQCVNLSVLTLV